MRQEIVDRVKQVNHEEVEMLKQYDKEQENPQKEEDEPMLSEPTDLYQERRNARYEESQRVRPNGSSSIAMVALKSVVEGDGNLGLARAYRRAKDDSEVLRARGEKTRAEMVKQQYTEDYFLPAVELVVNSCSPDDVLNSSKVLSELDKYALVLGSGRGYTASYIKQAYGNQLGQREGRSDAYIASEMGHLNSLLDRGQNRVAFGMAKKMKEQVDKGEHSATDADYDLISRVVAYYE